MHIPEQGPEILLSELTGGPHSPTCAEPEWQNHLLRHQTPEASPEIKINAEKMRQVTNHCRQKQLKKKKKTKQGAGAFKSVNQLQTGRVLNC